MSESSKLPNVVRISEIQDCIERTISGIYEGVLSARRKGIQAELPAKVDFEMVVVKEWQALEMSSAENGTTTEKGLTADMTKSTETINRSENGSAEETKSQVSIENKTANGTENQSGTETRRTNGKNSHVENGDTTTTQKQG